MAAIVAASSGSLWAAHSKLGSDSSPCVNERARGRRTAMRWPPSTTWLAVVPPRTARRWASGTPEAPHSATRSDSIRAASTFWPASMHRPRKAWRTSRNTPCTGNEICTWAVGNARSAGFMRDFISVVPFFACKAPGCSHPGERNRHLHLIRSTEFGTSPQGQPAGAQGIFFALQRNAARSVAHQTIWTNQQFTMYAPAKVLTLPTPPTRAGGPSPWRHGLSSSGARGGPSRC